MKTILGIDIGSITVSLVQLDTDRNILASDYRFHYGKIKDTVHEMLDAFDLSSVAGIALSSDTPEIFKHASVYDTRVSIIKTAKEFHQELDAILIVGGEHFGLIEFDEEGNYARYTSNSGCAAGTGSFLDQQAKRLNLPGIEAFSTTAYENKGEVPRIASRCAVFAKTDLIHAQQEGHSLAAICDGLCAGLAKNICDTLYNDTQPGKSIIFVGGVSKNHAVKKHIATHLGVDVITHNYSHLYAAIGAALSFLEEQKEISDLLPVSSADDMFHTVKKEKQQHYYQPLSLTLSTYPDFSSREKYEFSSGHFPMATAVEVDIYELLEQGKNIAVYMGIDIGSTSTKATLVDTSGNVLAGFYTRTAGRPLEAVQTICETIADIQQKKELVFTFQGVGTTGSGRKFVGQIIGADIALDEITAHARAAFALDKDVDTIIEIGGQDAKFTTMKNGMVTFSIMNNVCAAGTGSFIEEQAKKLHCPLPDYTRRAEHVPAPLASDRCTVFMERDLNHYLNEGYEVDEILASVLHSVRENYLRKVAIESSIGNKIFFQGATAKNKALVAAFEQRLQKPIMVSKYCHLTGALGAALHLLDAHQVETGFKGIEIYRQQVPIRSEICEICANHCKLKIAEIGQDTVAFGFLCGRDYQTTSYVNNNTAGFDLLKTRQKISAFRKPATYNEDFTIGLPAALHMFEEIPLWERFFSILGIRTMHSEHIEDAVIRGKKLAGAEFCAPMSAIHGHVAYLQEKADYVFLPVYLERKQERKQARRQYCYYTQFASSVIASQKKGKNEATILTPLIRSVKGNLKMKVELYKMLKTICTKRISFLQVSQAYEKALKEYRGIQDSLKNIYTEESTDNDMRVVFVGRPYTILSKSMNKNIPDIFARLGVKTFYQDMLSYDESMINGITPLLGAFHWHYASKILEAAAVVAQTPGVYPVFVTSFKCTPDSFVIEYFKKIMDEYHKPYLILQLDEHDSNVGYETRIEAGIRSFRNHFAGKETITRTFEMEANPDVSYDRNVLKGKTMLMPNWDPITTRLMAAQLRSVGIHAQPLHETNASIQRSLKYNSGQCIPLTAVAQETIDYVLEHKLDPKKTVLWMFDSSISCNVRMYPYYVKKILQEYGHGMEHISIYIGELTFKELSIKTAINMYLAYMFGGFLRKITCKIRPYENQQGQTDRVLQQSLDILAEAFLSGSSKEKAVARVISLFEAIPITKTERPKVAIFGDLYVRDNDIMNQDLVKIIEAHGGEVLTTPYSDYMKIIAEPYIKKWFSEGNYIDAASAKMLKGAIVLFERKYLAYFNRILQEKPMSHETNHEAVLSRLGVKIEHTGESMDNILKIFSLAEHYPDLSLFVQTNPAYCCPSLITEAMAGSIERLTGIPIVSIEYDGTGGTKNEDIIPYLKFPRKNILNKAGEKEA